MFDGKAEQIRLFAHQAYRGAGDGDRLREIILPVTPPVVLAATSRISETPICCAAVACSAANRALDEVSEPVRNTPSQPRNGEKKVNAWPVWASARPWSTTARNS